MSIAYVTPVHNWRNATNKSGRYSIHLRITIKRRHRYYAIDAPIKVSDAEWSGKDNSWVKNSHPYAFEINDRINQKRGIVTNTIKRFYTAQKTITFPAILKELKKSGNTSSFNQFFAEYNKRPTDGLEPDTLKKYIACLGHLDKFNPQIAFQDLTADLIGDFHTYLKKTAKLQGSTIDSYFDAFRKVVNLARKEHFISKDDAEEMFEDLHIDINKSKRSYLQIEEIVAWQNLEFTEAELHLERTRDSFLFQIYTGFYYKDMIRLKKEELVYDHEVGYMILGERDKNEEQNIIPLFKFAGATAIIEKYSSKDPNDLFVFRRDMFIEEPVYNRQLKTLSSRAKTKPVSNKTGRHTNVQLWIRLGAKKPVVSRMAGHNREQTLETYYRINPIEVIEGTKHINLRSIGL